MTTRKAPRRAPLAKSDAVRFLEELAGGPLTLGAAIEAYRQSWELSQVELARRFGVSRQYLCDVEKGRRLVSASQAAKLARKLGHSEALFIKLAVQDQLNSEGISTKITVEVA